MLLFYGRDRVFWLDKDADETSYQWISHLIIPPSHKLYFILPFKILLIWYIWFWHIWCIDITDKMNLLKLMVMQLQQVIHKPTSKNGRKKKAYSPSPTGTPVLNYSWWGEIKFLSSLHCLIKSNVVSSRWYYCHFREYVFYWWKEGKVISSNVGEGAYTGSSRMENTNRILNATTSRNVKLVKCKDARKISQEKESQTVQVFISNPTLLATVSSLVPDITVEWNSLGNEKSKIIDILRGLKWLCRLSWNQAGLISHSSDLSSTDPGWFLIQPLNRLCTVFVGTLLR